MYIKDNGEKVYSLKEKYEYYKRKANDPSSKNKQGDKIDFAGRVALANKAQSIKKVMAKNKKQYDYYNNNDC